MVTIRTAADVGLLIRDARKQAGLDQGRLAELANVSRLWINEVEKGKPNASLARVLRTLAVLGVEFDARLDSGARPASSPISTAELISRVIRR